ncbi:MAG TPA: hypothetical protein PKJ19_01375 [Flavobacteriales bacterium]|nr:hypothetical protein [Flavobacteriales bacterium]HNU55170.1 hypothetical protein [Flavobacteriales bacterium]
MKPLGLTLLFSTLFSLAHAQVITKLSNGTSTFYYNVDDLVAIVQGAAANDTIILPGGPINLNGSLIIDKKLILIGAGMLNSGTPITGTTTIIGTNVGGFQEVVAILSSGAGSRITGINFQAPVQFTGFGNNAPAFSASFERCMFSGSLALSVFASPVVPPSASNVSLKQCIIQQGITCSTNTAPQGLLVENCIITGGINFGAANIASAQVTQCIILAMTNNNGVNQGVTFTNNIFTRSGSSFSLSTASSYSNNLFVMSSGTQLNWSGAFDGGGNVGVMGTANNVFVNLGSFTAYSESYDYHLAPGSPGLSMGSNGQVGIYGGPTGSPWKEGAIPFNPHWISLSPSLGSTNGGVINVNLSGAAQQN